MEDEDLDIQSFLEGLKIGNNKTPKSSNVPDLQKGSSSSSQIPSLSRSFFYPSGFQQSTQNDEKKSNGSVKGSSQQEISTKNHDHQSSESNSAFDKECDQLKEYIKSEIDRVEKYKNTLRQT
eukprot:gb/GECH01009392.1/.p1 GENE.gb/GECH01009392.1/~~gb/GECH01009392.1/.p1  ORF type:complete len:122 (+),score=26.91 gb/GECH01009392.1/:1-366(+)